MLSLGGLSKRCGTNTSNTPLHVHSDACGGDNNNGNNGDNENDSGGNLADGRDT